MQHNIFSILLFGAVLIGFCACDEPTDPFNGHEYVDLGLTSGTLWATCNVGATNPEDAGDYFAWGETTPSTNYHWENYKWANGSRTKLTKYCYRTDCGNEGYTDDLVTLEAADDAATANWGGKWHMPTHIELFELRYECDWYWMENYNQTGVAGCYIVSKQNGNSIFLPAAGNRSSKNEPAGLGSRCFYWSSSYFTDSSRPTFGWCLDVDVNPENGVRIEFCDRCVGCSVRPVCSPQR